MNTIVKYFPLFMLIMCSCGNKNDQIRPIVMPLTEAVYASGNLKAYNQYVVYTKLSGLLKYRFVNENDLVRVGDVLAEIDNEVSSFNYDNSAELLQEAKGNADANSRIIKQLDTEIESAQIKMMNDSINYVRYAELYAGKAATKVDLDKSELLFRTSKNTYQNLLLKKSETENKLNMAYKNALHTYHVNHSLKDDRYVKSFINGKVYSFYKKPGELVQQNEPLAIIGDKSRIVIELMIDELDVNRIKLGQQVLVTLDTHGSEIFKAKIVKIYPILDKQTKTFTVEAEFINVPPNVYPGLTVEANIIIREKQRALTIPRACLFPGDSVLINKNEKIPIKTGIKNLEFVEVISGLDSISVLYKK